MKPVLFLFMLFLPLVMLAQEKELTARADSLAKQLAAASDDTAKVNLYYELSDIYGSIDPDVGVKYGTEGLKLAEKLVWKEGVGRLSTTIGHNNFLRSDYPAAITYWLKALAVYEELGNNKKTATLLVNIGNVYSIQGDFPRALGYFQKALAINEKSGDRENMSLNLASIGSAYLEQSDFGRALEYYNKALAITTELGDKSSIAQTIGNIGVVFYVQKKYPQALAYYFRALRMEEELGDKGSIVINLGNIGECYYLIAKDTAPVKKDSLVAADRKANLQQGIDYLRQAIKLAREIGYLNAVQEYSRHLADALALSGNYKDALAAYQQYVAAKDSVFNTENNIKITNLETKRELELKDKQIEIDRLAVAKKRNERSFFIAGILIMLGVIVIVYRNYKRQKVTNIQLSVEKQKSENLLLNILPAEVARELKDKGSANARQYEDVTVLFTDFVNFTAAAERMTPTGLVGELDTCFKAFDSILGKYNVEKIKTVGDAYLAVSGLPVSNPAHARNMVAAAIEMRDFMLQRREELGDATFGMRIGIHSGGVVAGIVGVKKFAYDIWGDTVNLAARMEQHSEPGRINISQTTYELVQNDFHFTPRGEVEAKNKGMLKMYFVQ